MGEGWEGKDTKFSFKENWEEVNKTSFIILFYTNKSILDEYLKTEDKELLLQKSGKDSEEEEPPLQENYEDSEDEELLPQEN